MSKRMSEIKSRGWGSDVRSTETECEFYTVDLMWIGEEKHTRLAVAELEVQLNPAAKRLVNVNNYCAFDIS